MKYILDQLIICAGQYQTFGEQQYSDKFTAWLRQLQRLTGKTEDQAIELWVQYVEGEEEMVAC